MAERGEFWVHCGGCSHEWVAATYPMEATAFCETALALASRCPGCGGKGRIFCGRKRDAGSGSVSVSIKPHPISEPADG